MIAQYQGYSWEGPFPIANTSFNKVPGVYLITNAQGTVVDVGETGNLADRILGHERKECWRRNVGVNLWFHYQPGLLSRLQIERLVRVVAHPACGVR